MKLDFLRGRAVDYGAVRGADVEAFQKPTLGSLVFLSGGWSPQSDRNTQTHDEYIIVSSQIIILSSSSSVYTEHPEGAPTTITSPSSPPRRQDLDPIPLHAA